MALFGGDVKTIPYQAPDYSGSVDAARGLANARAQGIAGGIGQVTDYFKQQGEKKKLIKQSDIQIDAALKLFPDLAPTLQGVRDQIKDENISLNERAGIAESVAGLINMGTKQMQANAEFGLRKRQLDIEEGRGIQSALIERAKMEAEANKIRPIIDINVPGGVMQMREDSQTGVLEPIQVAGQTPAAEITSALGDGPPMDIPTVEGPLIPANEGVISPDGTTVSYLGRQYTVDTGVLPARVPNEQAVSIDAGLSAAPAKGSIGFKPTKSEKQETPMTAKQVQDLVVQGFKVNARPLADGSFMVSGADIGGQSGETFEFSPEGGFKMTRGGGGKAEAAKEAQKEQSFERSRGIIGAAADSINMIKSDLSENSVIARAQQGLSIVLPASTEGRIAKNLETVKILNSKGEVNKMRAASPTGSAGGNITENEWKIFQNNFGTLEVGMYPPDLASNLQKTSLNQFEAVNGRPEDVIKLFNNGKITKPVFDEYIKEYKQTRSILGISDAGTGGPGDDWTKYNPSLLRFDKEKQSQLSPEAQSLQDRLDALKSNP